jgi:Putative rRNA methylase
MENFYKEHLKYLHNFWNKTLVKGDIVVDATIGNGYDSLYLSKLVLSEDKGFVFGYDIQKIAIENTILKLKENLPESSLKRIKLFNQSHESFLNLNAKNIKLITYNLGYLPRSDKSILTNAVTTLKSIKSALELTPSYISIVCYSGHQIGKIEEDTIITFLKALPKEKWTVSWKQWINRSFFPSVILLKNTSS